MAYNTLTDFMTGIADAIRYKDGTSDLIATQDMPDRIRAISGGGTSKVVIPILQNGLLFNQDIFEITQFCNSELTSSGIKILSTSISGITFANNSGNEIIIFAKFNGAISGAAQIGYGSSSQLLPAVVTSGTNRIKYQNVNQVVGDNIIEYIVPNGVYFYLDVVGIDSLITDIIAFDKNKIFEN